MKYPLLAARQCFEEMQLKEKDLLDSFKILPVILSYRQYPQVSCNQNNKANINAILFGVNNDSNFMDIVVQYGNCINTKK